MRRYLCLFLALFWNYPISAKEPLVLNLQWGESVAHLATSGSTLAIGAGYRGHFERGKSVAEQAQCIIVLVREGSPPTRTPLMPGTVRSIIGMKAGFLAARVVYNHEGHAATQVFEMDLNGGITEMPPLPVDLAGLWADEAGTVFAYDSRAIFRWSAGNQVWEKLALESAVNAEAIRRIATLKDGSSLVVTDRLLKGFKNLQEPPVFVKDLNTYPEPIYAFGNDRWWIVTSDGRSQKICIVCADGQTRQVASPRAVRVQEIMLGDDEIFAVCAGEGGDVHKSSYYVLNRDGTGPLRGPFMLPNDTMKTCIWGDSIVSGGATSRVYKTEIEH